MKKFKSFVIAFVMSLMALFPLAAPVFALDLQASMQEFGQSIGVDTQASLTEIIANLIKIVLGFLGIIVILIILYAGFLWMTAGGNDDNVKKAKNLLKNGLIGLALIVSAYAIASFVTASLTDAVSGGTGTVY